MLEGQSFKNRFAKIVLMLASAGKLTKAGATRVISPPDFMIGAGDTLILMGTPSQLTKLEQYAGV
jgi:uncharacterized protein with PhoU and TrkA domain